MHEHISLRKLISISLMLFALFFGAGNMIFPPSMGQAAGTNIFPALMGYIATDVGLPLITIAAIVFTGYTLDNMAGKVGKKFASIFAIVTFMMIGPLFAIPRTGSVSFEFFLKPFLGEGANTMVWSFGFTAVYFGMTYLFSSNPKKIVSIVGNFLTPILLISIFIIGLSAMLRPISPLQAPSGDYGTIPFFKGIIEGYQALDALAAAVFAQIVIENIKNMGIKSDKKIVKYTLLCGFFAAVVLTVIYGILSYVGATCSDLGQFSNGGELLSQVAYHMFGPFGMAILGSAVMFACLTTSIGLTTACGEYFSEKYPKLSYQTIIIATSLFGFAISNIGLSQLISFTIPVLLMVYPIMMALVFTVFFDKWINGKRSIYYGTLIGAAIISIPDGLAALCANLMIPSGKMGEILLMVPFYNLGIGWIIPSLLGAFIGYLYTVIKK